MVVLFALAACPLGCVTAERRVYNADAAYTVALESAVVRRRAGAVADARYIELEQYRDAAATALRAASLTKTEESIAAAESAVARFKAEVRK
jgi:hypothetical protein